MTLKKTKAWKFISLFVRQSGVCYTCGKIADPRELDCGHFFHRSAMMFFEIVFLRAQCTGCNRFKHGNLGIYAAKLIQEIGITDFLKAEKKSHERKVWSKKELLVIENKYKLLMGMKPTQEKRELCCNGKSVKKYCTLHGVRTKKKLVKKDSSIQTG